MRLPTGARAMSETNATKDPRHPLTRWPALSRATPVRSRSHSPVPPRTPDCLGKMQVSESAQSFTVREAWATMAFVLFFIYIILVLL